MRGPYLAGKSDTHIFKHGGLADKLRALMKRVIADNGYKGYDDVVSRPNSQDAPEISKLKSRARLRQETVNGKIKTWKATDSARFRHGKEKFKMCFEASVVLTQYMMEMGEPLFDV